MLSAPTPTSTPDFSWQNLGFPGPRAKTTPTNTETGQWMRNRSFRITNVIGNMQNNGSVSWCEAIVKRASKDTIESSLIEKEKRVIN